MAKKILRMKPGAENLGRPNEPVIDIVGSGRTAYLWIGNDAEDGWCFATISGPQRIRSFAQKILATIPPNRRKAK